MKEQITMKTFSILLADDDEDDRGFFKEALEKLNIPFRLTEFPDCKTLPALLEKQDFDIIFLDLNMPYISGLQCLQIIRENRKMDNIPIAIYSTSGQVADIESTYQAGANIYVVKPSAFTKIVTLLENIFSHELSSFLKGPKEKFVLRD